MASNILSRLLSSEEDAADSSTPPSLSGRQTDSSVPRRRASTDDLDEENLREHFVDQNLDELLREASDSRITTESTPGLMEHNRGLAPQDRRRGPGTSARWLRQAQAERHGIVSDDDDGPPASLLLEGGRTLPERPSDDQRPPHLRNTLPPPVTAQRSDMRDSKWQKAFSEQNRAPGLVENTLFGLPQPSGIRPFFDSPKERAMWRWSNVQSLDKFLLEVYEYYKGHGMRAIILSRALRMFKVAFMVAFTTFWTSCVNREMLLSGHKLSEAIIPKCGQQIHGFWNLVLWVTVFAWLLKFLQYTRDIQRLFNMRSFYHNLLEIRDRDPRTVPWPLIVERLMDLREANPITANNTTLAHRDFLGPVTRQRMDAHDIANRLMRTENYLIAIFNKDILDLRIPLPYIGARPFFSRSIEYFVNLCVMEFVFDSELQMKPIFLSDRKRRETIERLNLRFRRAAILSLFATPFFTIYIILLYCYRYFAIFYKDPDRLSARSFTPYAQWKFREFNELIHLFKERRSRALEPANIYMQLAPTASMNAIFDAVSFTAGALSLPLAVLSWLNWENAANDYIAGKSVIFWLGTFVAVSAISGNMSSKKALQEKTDMDTETALQKVIEHTHYCPSTWKNRLHSEEVRAEFGSFFKLTIFLFVDEIVSLIATPYILWFRLPRSSDRIIDFFREFTIHVDGVGHVCSFAVFDFQRQGRNVTRRPRTTATVTEQMEDPRDDYYSTKDNKLVESVSNFKEQYGKSLDPRRSRHAHSHSQLQRLASRPVEGSATVTRVSAPAKANATIIEEEEKDDDESLGGPWNVRGASETDDGEGGTGEESGGVLGLLSNLRRV